MSSGPVPGSDDARAVDGVATARWQRVSRICRRAAHAGKPARRHPGAGSPFAGDVPLRRTSAPPGRRCLGRWAQQHRSPVGCATLSAAASPSTACRSSLKTSPASAPSISARPRRVLRGFMIAVRVVHGHSNRRQPFRGAIRRKLCWKLPAWAARQTIPAAEVVRTAHRLPDRRKAALE